MSVQAKATRSLQSYCFCLTVGELWFFDNYVIPLTEKLARCGVFGVSSDEYLNYATANREEWSLLGESIVKEWKTKYSV